MIPKAVAWLPIAIAGLVALVVGLLGSALMMAIARRLGIVNQPNPLVPQHTRPVAYLGGVGVGLGIAAGFAALAALGVGIPGIAVLLPAVCFLALGVADDLLNLAATRKFVLQGIAAALAVGLGLGARFTGSLSLDAAISWMWLMTMVNAFNLTDVCDGLLASLGIVTFAALALLEPRSPAALAVAAACLGFLFLNRPPARIFLGDAGSHLLGFLAAAFTLLAAARGPAGPIGTLSAGALLAGVPLFELLFLVAVRAYNGQAWWRGSSDHFSLRLQAVGFTRGQTDLIACAWAVAGCAAGLALPRLTPAWIVTLVMSVVLCGGAAAAHLLRHEMNPAPRRGMGAASSSEMVPSRGAQSAS